tara:strand:- start:277 stop:576 length:300 start_codon:yes stop_codon:yes gene_type:complete
MKIQTKPTPADIRHNYLANDCGHFFDRATMKWFGDTMRSYAVIVIDGTVYLYRKPSATVNVFGTRKTAGRQFFNCWEVEDNGDLSHVMADVENMVWGAI